MAPGPPHAAEEHLVETFREEKIPNGLRSPDDADAVRDPAAREGYGRWFAILLAAAGIAALFLVLYVFARLL